MRSQRKDGHEGKDLVDELIGDESENEFTHKPEGTYEILNDIVVDRGPNPSISIIKSLFCSTCMLMSEQQCPLLKSSEMTSTSRLFKQTVSA